MDEASLILNVKREAKMEDIIKVRRLVPSRVELADALSVHLRSIMNTFSKQTLRLHHLQLPRRVQLHLHRPQNAAKLYLPIHITSSRRFSVHWNDCKQRKLRRKLRRPRKLLDQHRASLQCLVHHHRPRHLRIRRHRERVVS